MNKVYFTIVDRNQKPVAFDIIKGKARPARFEHEEEANEEMETMVSDCDDLDLPLSVIRISK
jgi:hypothetical protein